MRRWPALLLLTGALTLLASLYLPWQQASCDPGQCSGLRFQLLALSGALTVDGWSSGVGEVAAMFSLLLAAMAGLALARPNFEDRLPLRLCAVLVGYFGLAVAAQARSIAHYQEIGLKGVDLHYAYGAYLGVAGAVVVLLAAGAMRRPELMRDRSAAGPAFLALVIALPVAYLLPWERFTLPGARLTFLGIASPAAVVAAVLTLCLPIAWWRREAAARAELLALSAVVALFTVAAVSSLTFGSSHAYGAWIGLGAAVGLVAVALIEDARVSGLVRPPPHALATGGAAALLIAALFLPWQKACYATQSDFGPYSGRCVTTNGWTTLGSVAAVLALAVVVVAFAPRRIAASTIELTAGVALLVATLGFQLEHQSGDDVRLAFGYGAEIGFAGGALLVVLAVLRLRPPVLDRKRTLVRLAPIGICAAYLVVVVLPWWDVLPRDIQSGLLFAPISWLTIAGVLVGIRLLRLWARQIVDASAAAWWLVLLPLALLALAALDLIRLRDDGITWGRGAIVGLCLLLALLGRVEQRQGLENFRIPEVLRVDRL